MATRFSFRKVCKYPGCKKLRYKESTGFTHDFCGRTHAMEMAKTTHLTSPISYSKSTNKTSGLKPLKALRSYVQPSNEIKFYNSYEEYYEFTNFYPAVTKIDGLYWPSSEHYFQAQKFVGTPFVEKIRKMSSARETFQCSRNPAVSRWQRSDWDQTKDDIMLKALRCKFGQSDKLRSLLVNTGDKKLIEHTANDSYWGDGGDKGKGLNKLGKLLMQVRGELQQKDAQKRTTSKLSGRSPLKRSNSFSFTYTKESPKYTSDDTQISSKSSKHFYSSSLRRYGSQNSLPSLGGAMNPLPTGTGTQSSTRHHYPTYTKSTTRYIPRPTSTSPSSLSFSPRMNNDSSQVKAILMPDYTK